MMRLVGGAAVVCAVLHAPGSHDAPAPSLPCAAPAPFVAFSLREASRRARDGVRDEAVWQLAGMTRLVGMVHDPDGDVVLVGRRVAGLPAGNLADLAGALRARLVHGQWPELSIDPDAQTAASGTLAVTTKGGIAATTLHAVLQEADVFLKRYAMQTKGPIPALPSYAELMVEGARRRAHDAGATVRWLDAGGMAALAAEMRGVGATAVATSQVQFWFAAQQPYGFKAPEGVFGITELRLGVKVKRLGDEAAGADASANEFAQAFTEQLAAAARRCEAVQRLKIVYDMVAIAEGIRSLPQRPDLGWLLNACPVAAVGTSDRVPSVDLCAVLEQADGVRQVVQLSGGVEVRAEVAWLNDGDLSPLRDLVLAHRPSPDSLWWEPPLTGWRMINGADLEVPAASATVRADLATAVFAQHYSIAAPGAARRDQPAFPGFRDFAFRSALATPGALGGVSMVMPIRSRAFRMDDSGLLDAIREAARQARPGAGSLSWPVGGEKKR